MTRTMPRQSQVCPAMISVLMGSPRGIVFGPMADQCLAIDEDGGSWSLSRHANGQNRVAVSPFSARCLRMGAHHGAIDHLQWVRDRSAFVQGVRDFLSEACQHPAPELPVDARPFPERLRQVSPRGSGAGNPENSIQNKLVVGGFASVWGADREDETLKERRFLARHRILFPLVSIADRSLNHDQPVL